MQVAEFEHVAKSILLLQSDPVYSSAQQSQQRLVLLLLAP